MKKGQISCLIVVCIALFLTACNKDDMPIKPPTTTGGKDTTVVVSGTQGGVISLSLNAPQQKIDLMGAGCYFYSGHMIRTTNYNDLSDWLFRDLDVNVFRIVLRNGGVEDTNDNSDPNVTDFTKFNFGANTNNTDQIVMAKKAISINPNIKIWAIILSPPKFLKTNDNVNFGGSLNVAVVNAHEEFGESTYAHLKFLKDNGLTVDFLSLMNEPDFPATTIGYESADYTPIQAREVYKNTVNWLKTKLATTNITMPKISGPDCISVRSIANYAPLLEATGNIDLYTAHQYANSSVANFTAASTSLGTKPLYMPEMHIGHGKGETPDELLSALDLVTRFHEAFKGGAKGWLYFEWGNPKTNFGGLTFTPYNGAAERKKNYFVFQQFSTNLLNSNYVATTLTDAKSAYEKMGNYEVANEYWEKASEGLSNPSAAIFYNDQQPDKIFYQGMALLKLGKSDDAQKRFDNLSNYGQKHKNDVVKLDYFAVSLPDLLIWEEDLSLRNKIHCAYLIGLGELGRGNLKAASEAFDTVFSQDLFHLSAFIHQKMVEDFVLVEA